MAKKAVKAAKKKKRQKKVTARKARPERKTKSRARRALTAAPEAAGLDLVAAGEIVRAALPGGPHDIDLSLEEVGLISPGQRTVFRQDVVDGVVDLGFTIDENAVPNAASTKLRAVRTAVRDNAVPSGGA
jgi:hypothetical protein